MKLLFSRKTLFWIGCAVFGVLLILIVASLLSDRGPERETASVERGDIEVLVSVSGSVRTPNTATLGFPQAGTVREVLVREGDAVVKGQILASLSQSTLIAEYNDALAYLRIQEAERDELVAGPRGESRAVTLTTLEIAEAELERVTAEQERLAENALRALYSSGLEAVPVRPENSDTPPTITGTYQCDMPITYRFEVYPSGAKSGYSYRFLEGGSGAESAVAESATPFGECGLFIQFDAAENYGKNEWLVAVPNTRGASYATNLNAYTAALQKRENEIESAKQDLEKAEGEAGLDLAVPRAEELARAEASVSQARARLAEVEARIGDVTIKAPFDGIVTSVDVTVGEVGQPTSGITMTANDAYELRIRVPEIDITHIAAGDRAIATFDARPEEPVAMTITFVSPLPGEIDGVSYFDAYLAFDELPTWMRTGLNADVDVIVEEARGVLRLPARFVGKGPDGSFVNREDGTRVVEHAVSTGLLGNNGYIEVSGIDEGARVVLP